MSAEQRADPRRLADAILALLEQDLAADGYELLDVRVFRGGGRLQVRLYVDLPGGGIDLDGCARASRTAGMLLEEADLVGERHVIEVSSPGIRRPLRTPAHFAAAVGQRVELRTGPRTRVRGVLEATGPQGHVVRPEAEDADPITVPPAQVIEANLDPDFDAQALINADRRRRKEARRSARRERRGKGKSKGKGKRRRGGDAEQDAGEDRRDGST